EKLEDVNTSRHYTAQPLTPERIGELDHAKMLAFYRQRFANAADFTLFVVGAFKEDAIVPLLARYVGSLPSTSAPASQYQQLGIQFPASSQRAEVVKGREPRSETVVSFFADPSDDPADQESVGAASTVLELTLRDMLREELGQTYTVSVGLSQS